MFKFATPDMSADEEAHAAVNIVAAIADVIRSFDFDTVMTSLGFNTDSPISGGPNRSDRRDSR